MRLLVTGVDGYIGCLLAPYLMERGHEVVGLDTGFYRSGWLFNGVRELPRTLTKDIRLVTAADLEGFDAVVHLAELSNDPLGELAPATTFEINHGGSVRLAEMARQAGVSRFVYTSSCSVYGVASGVVDETSPTSPQTAYAECKVLVERDVGAMAADDFSPTFLRNATAFGASPRMRFDIVLNNLAGVAFTTGEIKMTSDGTPWRPLVHVLDIAKAVACALDAPREVVHGEIFNVGSTEQNYQVKEVADTVGDVFRGCTVTYGPPSADNRSYKVAFDKIHEAFPSFSCEWSARRGAEQLYDVFRSVELGADDFASRHYTRLRQLQYLLGTGQVDESLFWSGSAEPGERVPGGS